MGLPNGVHHIAISTADAKRQIEFFSNVLGAELTALYWMHGADNAIHAFLKLDDFSYFALVQSDEIVATAPVPGVSHANAYTQGSAPGTLQHLSFNVSDRSSLLALRDRIRSRGYNVFGPVNHGYCESIYFPGPEGLLLEAATSAEPIDPGAWIDPEVVERLGISAEELKQFVAPEPTENRGGAVPQPPIDPQKPRINTSEERYRWLMSASDDEITQALSEPEPPVKQPQTTRTDRVA